NYDDRVIVPLSVIVSLQRQESRELSNASAYARLGSLSPAADEVVGASSKSSDTALVQRAAGSLMANLSIVNQTDAADSTLAARSEDASRHDERSLNQQSAP